MRPQRIAAENRETRELLDWFGVASMRPQRIAAENNRYSATAMLAPLRFNEAAADRCGKRPNLFPIRRTK